MVGGVEAAGDLVTGGLLASAIDRDAIAAPGAGHADAHGGACLDCGTPLIGAHCHACGQAAHVHRTMGGFAHEVLHGVFHFEGKIWRTLPMLAFHPGHLTRRYIDGERTKFVTPMALFLFSVFLMFAIVSHLPMFESDDLAQVSNGISGGFNQAQGEIAKGMGKARTRLARAQASRAQLVALHAPTDAVDLQIAQQQKQLADLGRAALLLPGHVETSPKVRRDARNAATGGSGEPAPEQVGNWIERKFAHARENPSLFVYKMKSAGYKYSWALIPISLPFIWLMFFWKRRFGMYDHAVFSTYSLSFMSLLVVGLSLIAAYLPQPGPAFAWLAFMLVPPIHMYKQLRYTYALGRLGAALRTFLLLVTVTITSSLFFIFLLYLGAAD